MIRHTTHQNLKNETSTPYTGRELQPIGLYLIGVFLPLIGGKIYPFSGNNHGNIFCNF